MKKMSIGIFILLMSTTTTYAQFCRPGYPTVVRPHCPPIVHTPVVHTPVVVAPIAVPIYIPPTVFQYLPALNPSMNQAIPVQQQIAPVASNSPVSMPPQIVQPNSNDKGPPNLIIPNDLGLPNISNTSIENTGDINAQVVKMLSSKSCVNCHTSGGAQPVKGGVSLFTQKDKQLFFQPNTAKQTILNSVSGANTNGRPIMPPEANGNPNHPAALRPDEINLLRKWILTK